MSPNDLRAQCGDSDGHITLVIQRKPKRRHNATIRLMPRSGPMGRIVECNDLQTVATFSCKAILRWLKRFEGEVVL